MPGVSAKNNWTNGPSHVTESNGRITMTVRRKVDTNDATDFVFPLDKSFPVGWALNSSTSTLSNSTKHQTAGNKDMTLSSVPSNGDDSDHDDHDDHDHDHEHDGASILATTSLAAAGALLLALQ